MHIFGVDDSSVNAANLNSLLSVYDAVVSASVGTASGDVYPTISSAISAGHRSIAVVPGTYTEDITLSSGNQIIDGVGPVIEGWTGTKEVKIVGQITISSSIAGIELRRLHILPPSGKFAIYHNSAGRDCYYEKIYAWNGDSNHFEFNTRYADFTMRDCHSYNCGANAFRISDNVDAHSTRGTFDNCHAYGATGNGFFIGGNDADTSHYKEFALINCKAFACAESYGHGFQIGKYFRGVILGCVSAANVAGSGFYFWDPGTTGYARTVVACVARGNGQYGFARSAAGGAAAGDEAYAGCYAVANSAGQWANYVSTPPTCI